MEINTIRNIIGYFFIITLFVTGIAILVKTFFFSVNPDGGSILVGVLLIMGSILML